MTIVLPYVAGMLERRTWAWAATVQAMMVLLPAGEDDAYWRALANAWTHPLDSMQDLVVVEQDIAPAAGVVKRMQRCKRPWCVSPYPIAGGRLLDEGLGCTKFARRLKDRHPDLLERAGRIDDDGQPAKTWRRLDTRIARLLRELGYAPHRHAASEHLHDYARRP